MDTKKRVIRAAVAWLLLTAFLVSTRPQHVPVLLLIVPFVLLFWALVSSWVLVVPLLRRATGKRGSEGSRRLRYAVCGGAVLLVIMQSLGQLTVRDFGTIIAIVIIGYVYLGRSRSSAI